MLHRVLDRVQSAESMAESRERQILAGRLTSGPGGKEKGTEYGWKPKAKRQG